MTTTALRPELEPLPSKMRGLPIDDRGYVVPFFVAWVDGKPDHRVQDARKWQQAVGSRLCWVCGQPLGRWLAFAIGPMCAITRTTSEPPAHRECAEWSIRNCPFLSQPHQARRPEYLPAGHVLPAGETLLRNPGVTCLWITRSYETFSPFAGRPGRLITVGAPEGITWWCEGRAATRAEVQTSIDGGLPSLLELARSEGRLALEALERHIARLEPSLPPADGA